jgi:mevalonate kinase
MEYNKELYFKCKSPGKIIISGEHAVVYDMRAIACAIDLYTNCSMKVIVDNKNYFRLFLKNLNFRYEIENDKILIIDYKNILLENYIQDENDINNLLNLNIFQFIGSFF